jgi:hypothetical protein
VQFGAIYAAFKIFLNGKPAIRAGRTSESRIALSGKSYPFSEIVADPNLQHVQTIRTKIRGVTWDNRDGKNRQQIIRQWCHSGDAIDLSREPTNRFDSNAIQVRRIVCCEGPDKFRLGETLGYLSHELAEKLAPDMDKRQHTLMGTITAVMGGEYQHSLGVNIQIEEYRPAKHIAHRREATNFCESRLMTSARGDADG